MSTENGFDTAANIAFQLLAINPLTLFTMRLAWLRIEVKSIRNVVLWMLAIALINSNAIVIVKAPGMGSHFLLYLFKFIFACSAATLFSGIVFLAIFAYPEKLRNLKFCALHSGFAFVIPWAAFGPLVTGIKEGPAPDFGSRIWQWTYIACVGVYSLINFTLFLRRYLNENDGFTKDTMWQIMVFFGIGIFGIISTNLLFPLITHSHALSWAGAYWILFPVIGLVYLLKDAEKSRLFLAAQPENGQLAPAQYWSDMHNAVLTAKPVISNIKRSNQRRLPSGGNLRIHRFQADDALTLVEEQPHIANLLRGQTKDYIRNLNQIEILVAVIQQAQTYIVQKETEKALEIIQRGNMLLTEANSLNRAYEHLGDPAFSSFNLEALETVLGDDEINTLVSEGLIRVNQGIGVFTDLAKDVLTSENARIFQHLGFNQKQARGIGKAQIERVLQIDPDTFAPLETEEYVTYSNAQIHLNSELSTIEIIDNAGENISGKLLNVHIDGLPLKIIAEFYREMSPGCHEYLRVYFEIVTF